MMMTTITLADVADVFNGKTPARSDQRDSGFPVLKIKDVDENGRFRGTFSGRVDPDYAAKHKKKFARSGDTMILNAAHSATHVASKTFFANEDVAGSLATGEWLIVRPHPDKLFPAFANHWVNNSTTRFALRKIVNGIHLYPRDVASLRIPIPHKNGKPDLVEQQRIAAILDKADDIRRKRQEALRLTDDFLRSVFLDLFGDPVRNPKGWAEDELKNLGKVSTGSTPPSKKDAMFGGEIPFVTPGDLSEGPVSSRRTVTTEGAKNSRTVRPGATFVCCIGATIGKMGKAATRSAFNQQINAVEWNGRIADDYGLEVLKFFKGIIASRGSSTTLPILNKSAFQSLVIPVPPRRLQDKFSETITSLSRFRSRQEGVDSYGADFFAALQQRAFRGEL